MDPRQAALAVSRAARGLPAAAVAYAMWVLCTPTTALAKPEDELRAAWVGRWVVLRTAALSDCDERYTDNRLRGTQPASGGRHRFDPGELGRIDNLNLQRARIDLLVTLSEPLRVEVRDGPFQIYEQLECRIELELPAPREAVRRGAVERLDRLIRGTLESYDGRLAAQRSPTWNRRRVEPLPDDHEERLAAYHAWKEQQLYRALRTRLAEALDRAADIASDADHSAAYARGLGSGARNFERHHFFSPACDELPAVRFSARRGQAPEELDDRQEQDWKDGFEDGQLLLFEIEVARRIERCLP